MGEIGSSGHVWEFPNRWIGEKHGRWGAFSKWAKDGIYRWREIRPVLFQRVLLILG